MRALAALICLTSVAAIAAGCDSDAPIRIEKESRRSEAPGVLRTIDTLQCPRSEGVLTLRGAPAANGRSCEYTGPRGALVMLRLITPENGMVNALDDLETGVRATLPEPFARLGGDPIAPPESPDGATGEDVDVQVPGVHIRSRGETAVVRAPGISIDADGERASVRIGGFRISSDANDERVEISSGDEANEAVRIRAEDNAVEIRTRDSSNGVRATYILIDERDTASGWRLVGFEARGPSDGPLAAAVVHSKDREQDDVFDAAKALVRLNVGD